jgi:putative endonuclease
MHYVYIIYSYTLEKFYTGVTQNIEKRVDEHNKGDVKFTSRGMPWILVFYEAFVEKLDSYREEKFLKTGKGRERRNYLLSEFIRNNLRKGVRVVY